MEIFESHAHYDDEKFNEDRKEVIEEVHASNISKIISAGYSLEGSKRSLELAKKYPFIYSTVGISPNDLNENYENEIEEIDFILDVILNKNEEYEVKKAKAEYSKLNEETTKKLYNTYKDYDSKKLVAVGEIGLDYHYDTNQEIQRKAFIEQIKIANKYNLPIVIHTREAVMDTLQILKENKVNRTGVFHCCPHNRELIKEGLKLGFYISFSGTCTFKNAHNAEECVKMVPSDKFLVETDSPYLAPEPVRGSRNDSRNLKYIVAKVAEFRGETPEKIAKQSYENTCKLYNIGE